jgi:hypothetical protein
MKFQTLRSKLSIPVLAPLLRERMMTVIITLTALVVLGLYYFRLPGWSCPFLTLTGIPCPGCGMTRALSALIRGDWDTSFKMHAFAPVVLAALVLVFVTTLLPARARQALISHVEKLERRTGLTALFLAAFFVYWLARLFFHPTAFIQLIKG